ncbi:hypothetical protein IJG14_07405 [bacterium]|nr:hypothetical protein [bacterium]
MNLNGINHQPQVLYKAKEAEKTAEKQPLPVQEKKTEKKASDAGCLKNYVLASASFGGHQCKTGDFAVKKLKDVPCCCCGKPMLRESDMQQCKRAVANTQGAKLAATIDEYGKYMRADERCVASIIADKAKETGCDVSQGMRQTSSQVRELTGKYANGILDGLNAMATEAFKNEENPVADIIKSAKEEIAKGQGLDRSAFVASLEEAGSTLGEEMQGKLQDTAMNLPQTFNHVQKIYGKYAQKTPDEIARRLFSTAMTTAEHIHPHSLGGPDNTANYIAECAGCNNPRGSMDYADWLKIHPEYPRKAQEHVEHVEARLINGEIGRDYNDWPVDVRGSLSKESGGRMQLKVLNPSTIENMRKQKGLSGKVTVQDVQEAYQKQEAKKKETEKS